MMTRAENLDRDESMDAEPSESIVSSAQFCLWAFMGTITMLFIALISAYLVRRSGSDWHALRLPSILWWNALLLIPSTWTMAAAKRSLKDRNESRLSRYLLISLALAGIFLAGQAYGWKIWIDRGIFLSSNPYCSFFYLFSSLHAIHVLGGIVWLGILLVASLSSQAKISASTVHCASDYWLFLAVIWLGLLGVLTFL
jgi:cytochrome c oxidase subunit III